MAALILAVFFFSDIKDSPQIPENDSKVLNSLNHESKIKIGEKEINVEIADTLHEKDKGLSGKTHISDDEGMLFIFTPKTYPGFWMKNMNFAIDIIWISDNTIVQIDENIPPPPPDRKDSDLTLYRPPKAVNFVLEVNAGFSQKNSIKVGDSVKINF